MLVFAIPVTIHTMVVHLVGDLTEDLRQLSLNCRNPIVMLNELGAFKDNLICVYDLHERILVKRVFAELLGIAHALVSLVHVEEEILVHHALRITLRIAVLSIFLIIHYQTEVHQLQQLLNQLARIRFLIQIKLIL